LYKWYFHGEANQLGGGGGDEQNGQQKQQHADQANLHQPCREPILPGQTKVNAATQSTQSLTSVRSSNPQESVACWTHATPMLLQQQLEQALGL
jgi:hypothetical protein